MSSSACRSAGTEDGPVVVLVHGFPDNRTVWDRVVDDLERDHRVATYDVRGAGESTAPSSRAGYKMSRLVDDLSPYSTRSRQTVGRPPGRTRLGLGAAVGSGDAGVRRRAAARPDRLVHLA